MVKAKYFLKCNNEACKEAIFPWAPEFLLTPRYASSRKKMSCPKCNGIMEVDGKLNLINRKGKNK